MPCEIAFINSSTPLCHLLHSRCVPWQSCRNTSLPLLAPFGRGAVPVTCLIDVGMRGGRRP
jgi:hypothetical protein